MIYVQLCKTNTVIRCYMIPALYYAETTIDATAINIDGFWCHWIGDNQCTKQTHLPTLHR